MNFLEKVMAVLEGGDKAKILKFQKRATKKLTNSIKATQDEIEDYESRLEDVRESQVEAATNLDMDALGSTADVDNYVDVFCSANHRLMKESEALNEQISDAKGSIKEYQSLLKIVKD